MEDDESGYSRKLRRIQEVRNSLKKNEPKQGGLKDAGSENGNKAISGSSDATTSTTVSRAKAKLLNELEKEWRKSNRKSGNGTPFKLTETQQAQGILADIIEYSAEYLVNKYTARPGVVTEGHIKFAEVVFQENKEKCEADKSYAFSSINSEKVLIELKKAKALEDKAQAKPKRQVHGPQTSNLQRKKPNVVHIEI